MSADLELQVLLPDAPAEPVLFACKSSESGAGFVQRVSERAGISPEVLTLYIRNRTGRADLFQLAPSGAPLSDQGVSDGAVVNCMVSEHVGNIENCVMDVTPGIDTSADTTTGEASKERDDVATGDETDGDDDFNHGDWSDGSPTSAKGTCDAVAEDEEYEDTARQHAMSLVDDAVSSFVDHGADTSHTHNFCPPPRRATSGNGKGTKIITSYSWTDRSKCVRVYVSADSEPLAFATAAADEDCLATRFEEFGFTLSVCAKRDSLTERHVLELNNLAGPVLPDKSSCFLDRGKRRIVIVLQKADPVGTWAELQRRQWVSPAEMCDEDEDLN